MNYLGWLIRHPHGNGPHPSPIFPRAILHLYMKIWLGDSVVTTNTHISEQLHYVLLLLFTFVQLTHLIEITAAAKHITDSAVDTLEDY